MTPQKRLAGSAGRARRLVEAAGGIEQAQVRLVERHAVVRVGRPFGLVAGIPGQLAAVVAGELGQLLLHPRPGQVLNAMLQAELLQGIQHHGRGGAGQAALVDLAVLPFPVGVGRPLVALAQANLHRRFARQDGAAQAQGQCAAAESVHRPLHS